jgi:glycerol uptake facilitator protein
VLFGTGVVQMTGAQSGLWQAAVVWGVVVALAICSVGVVSGAHTNPAMRTAASEGKSQEPEE